MSVLAESLRVFLRGFVHAFHGIFLGLRTQRNLRIHALAVVVVITLGLLFQIEIRKGGGSSDFVAGSVAMDCYVDSVSTHCCSAFVPDSDYSL